MTNPSATLNLLNIRPSSVHRFPVHALISPDFQRFHRFFGDKFYILSIQTIVLCRHRLQTFFCLFVRIKLYLIAGGFCYLWIVKGELRFVFILFILFIYFEEKICVIFDFSSFTKRKTKLSLFLFLVHFPLL